MMDVSSLFTDSLLGGGGNRLLPHPPQLLNEHPSHVNSNIMVVMLISISTLLVVSVMC